MSVNLLHRLITVALLVISLFFHTAECEGKINGFISFGVTELVADEDSNSGFTTVSIPFVREIGNQGNVLATYEVINSSASAQFLSLSNSVNFNGGQTEANGFLVLINDAVPEVNQTYIVDIIDARFGAEVGPTDRLYLTVRASDDPFGRIQFESSSLVRSAIEPLSGSTSTVSYDVIRGPGLHGQVSINYEVTGGPNSASLDVSLGQGQLIFEDGQNASNFTLSILPDNIPENNETFTVRLYNPGGGAVVADNDNEAQLIIISNDTPLRFASSSIEVSENVGTAQLTVYRGDIGGVSIGPLDQVTTVQYSTLPTGTAIAGLDYTYTTGTLTFPSGSTSATIGIPIINDTVPEGDETFTVALSNPSDDAVLHTPINVTVIIDINDNAGGVVRFQSIAPQTISEDNQTNATFIIQRDVSTLGSLTISYSIKDSNNQLASSDFDPASGQITIPNGVDMSQLVIRAIDDTLPEEAESFTVSIDGVQSGEGQLNTNETLRVALLHVSDSDDVYGIIGTSGTGSIAVNSDGNRVMSFTLTRSQGTTGEVVVVYSILYLPPGVTDPSSGMSGVAAAATSTATFPNGHSTVNAKLNLLTTGMLEEAALVYIQLVSAELSDAGSLLTEPSSPRISTTSFTVNASVPLAAANGHISFAPSSLMASVSEPDNGFSLVSLTIQRNGEYGDALVTWTASASSGSSFTTSDIGINAAQVLIPNGASSASFSISIVADDVPELDESFNVKLLSVAQVGQNIATTNITAVVTILENDEPGGTFSIASTSEGPFYIEESPLDSLSIQIQRNGGDLTTEQVLYRIVPSGSDDFIGSSGLVTFSPSNRSMTVSIGPSLDDIPEINETFTFEIYSTKDIIRPPYNASITILANDDWNGVFNFSSSSISSTIDEPANPGSSDPSLVSTANLTVIRNVASFGDATVHWEAANLNTIDIEPTSGSVSFSDGVSEAVFQVSAQADNITEFDISHMIRLVSVSGGGRLDDSGTVATVTVRQSDDPVSISSNDLVKSGEEGDVISINVTRGGRANGVAVVSFSVIYTSTSSSDVSIDPATSMITLMDGDRSGIISITLLDDAVPELMEQLQIRLTSVTGDAVIASANTLSTISINESDDPNGLFQFNANSLSNTVTEGSSVDLTIERLKGTFGNVTVFWRALYNSNGVLTPVPPLTDISVTSDSVMFREGQTTASITITILNDDIPELTEDYTIEITNATTELAVVSIDNETASITVPENDYPYGVFQLDSPGALWLGEDIPDADTSNGTGVFNVSRTAGTFNDIQVVWEVRPIPAPSLPTSFTDLLLVGSRGSGVSIATPRPSTGTTALSFTGGSSSLVTVPSALTPHVANNMSISVWFIFNGSVNGVLVGSANGNTVYYGLALVSDTNQYIVRLLYLPSTLNSGSETVEVSVPSSSLPMNEWHLLVLSVSGTSASFYIDGTLINTRTLSAGLSTASSDGVVTAGGLTGSQYFVGNLQDVRIYETSLDQQQVSDIYSNPAADHFQYISGVVTVHDRQDRNTFSVQTKDDSIPEPTTNFTLSLIAVSGEAQLSTTNLATTITVLKSDYSNGLFGLSSLTPFNNVEGATADIIVTRSRSSIGTVTVAWEIRNLADGSLADDDFEESSGTIVFSSGINESYFTVQSTNESVPELDESFSISLTAATVDDTYPSSTPTSGASLSPNTTVNVTILSNDYPYGVFQFEASPPPVAGVIPSADAVVTTAITEEIGSVVVYIVRAQGTVGTARVDYTTNDGTALSGGVSPDYVPTGGTLMFADGERIKNISIAITNDQTPELAKYFYVNLSNPIGNNDGTPILGTGSDIVITISPSDDAYGVFSFNDESLSQIVSEDQSGSTLVSYVVERGNKGRLGTVTVYWEVVNGGNDVSQSNGSVVFGPGVPTSVFFFTITNDMNPELHENFTVRLVRVSDGRISDTGNAVAILTIRASDRPYGVFTFSPSFSPLSITEDAGTINVIILREFGMEGTVEVYYTNLNDSTEEGYAIAGFDYTPVSGSVVFTPNQTMASFSVSIIDDTLPEIPETFYIILVNATLLDDDGIHLGTDALPLISSANASILIEENDNPRGIFSFTSSSFTAEEGTTDSITVTRTAGTYGEVTISWFITLINASSSDVNAVQGTDTIPDGVSLAPLSITVIDDALPEFTESFFVALTTISGGADLGLPILATVTIPTSDDPYGAFVFAESSRSVSVPEPDSGMSSITINVTREGGTLGLAFVDYNITSASGEPVSSDLTYDSISNLYFANGVRERSLTVRILSDDIPEITEVFYVNLFGVTGGGRVGAFGVAEIRILANDKPYGSAVYLRDSEILTMENDENATTINIPVYRTGGLFDDVSVVYSIRSATPSSLDRYQSPSTGISPPTSVLLLQSSDYVTSDRLNECGVKCVEDYTVCQSFAYDSSTSLCQLYRSTVGVSGSVTRSNTVQYYEAIPGQLELLARHIASASQDFEYLFNANVTIPAGRNSTHSDSIEVSINSDTLPELRENLTVSLMSVSVSGVNDDSLLPVIGNYSDTIISIAENDDPYGLFSISISQLSTVQVHEPSGTGTLPVTLTITRSAGTNGPANVSLIVNGVTATLNSDFSINQTLVQFADGESSKTVVVHILGDAEPEADESLTISLSNPTGGASITGEELTIVILTNDNAAGTVRLASDSRAATISEGGTIRLTVERSVSQLGRLLVNWTITGSLNSTNNNNNNNQFNGNFTGNNDTFFINGTDIGGAGPESQFQTASSFIIFEEGVTSVDIVTTVIDDNIPEVQEPYYLTLVATRILSSGVGEAILDANGNVAIITIRASDDPYGVVEILSSSQPIEENESDQPTVTVLRNFGSLGRIVITYQAVSYQLSGQMSATPGDDFDNSTMTVIMEENEASATIIIPIINDDIPELSEVFAIQLLSAYLESDPSVSVPLNPNSTLALITINPNDNPSGMFQFTMNELTVSEDAGIIDIEVVRTGGLFGSVTVMFQTVGDLNDFTLINMSIVFADGVSSEVAKLNIINDNMPELDESFDVQIFSVSNEGLTGDNNSLTVTISANDDPNGRFGFSPSSLSVSVEEAGAVVNDDNIAELTVIREGGTFGTVTVPYMIETAGANDLSPTTGLLVFQEHETQQVIRITAVADTEPEIDETYSIFLETPISPIANGSSLIDDESVAMITIPANQNPYGTFELYAPNSLSSLSVEEDVGTVRLELRRTTPSFNDIIVHIATLSDSSMMTNDTNGTIDYTPVSSPIVYGANVSMIELPLGILNDDIPELDETLIVQLVNVSGGAMVGDNREVTITVLTNDDAYGAVGFAESSLSEILSEPEFGQSTVNLVVERTGGLLGNITVAWSLSGDHSSGEVTPANGTLTFNEGQESDMIQLTVSSDETPEISELTNVVLTSFIDNGVPEGGDQTKGARIIESRSTAVITVTANDNPFGSVSWAGAGISIAATESNSGSNPVTLTILRVSGNHGDIEVTYRTTVDDFAIPGQGAVAGADYANVSEGLATIRDRETSTTINILILPDNIPEIEETFAVELVSVRLLNDSLAVGAPPNSPNIQQPAVARVSIAENDFPQGLMNIDPGPFTVSESVDTTCIPVYRSGGMFSTVGASYSFTDGSATGGSDFDNTEGTISIGPQVSQGCLNVTITNDNTPESEESFTVTLFNPTGGVTLGENLTSTIIISKNDDVNGVFSFSSGSLVMLLPEGTSGTFTIDRAAGSVGENIVYWSLSSSGSDDMNQTNGSVVFTDSQTSGTFELQALEDGVPELYEVHSVTLTSIVGEGRLSHPLTASIAIPANDNPSGVIAFAEYTYDTVIIEEGGSATISVLRTAGLFGSVSVQWQITPSDSTAFVLTSGSVFFGDGANVANFTLSTIQDTSPEVAKIFTLSLVAAGDADINSSSSDINIIIPSSDNVHGSIGFSPLTVSTSESVDSIDITVLRSGGLEGDLLINFTVSDIQAVSPDDYQINATYVMIPDGSNTAIITAAIVDDSEPEIDESFSVTLTAVTLLNYNNGGRDFTYPGDDSLIDSLPTISDSSDTFQATIAANDDAFGVISLTTNSYQVEEGTTLLVNVERSGGTFGTLSLQFTVQSVSALGNGIDYSAPTSPINILPGQALLQLTIPIIDDINPELQESFTVTIDSVEGGASLGTIRTATVIILPSDNPNGRVRFTDSDISGRVVANPVNSPSDVMLEVLRLDGSIGSIDVTWEVTGPSPGFERDDILQSTLQGVLTFGDQQTNNFITVTVLTNNGPEPEENFTITLTAATKGVAIDEDGQTALLTVSQKGIPFGVIGFYGTSLSTSNTPEGVNLTLPLVREQGTFGTSEVFFVVSGPSPLLDLSPVTGSVVFEEGDVYVPIDIFIISDNIPELLETYTVTLTGINGRAVLNSNTLTSTFNIIANDSPYGTFGITDLSLQLAYAGQDMIRRLSFTISRQFGLQGSVDVTVGITYTEEPNAGYFPSSISRSFINGQDSISVTIDSTATAFLAAGSILNVSVATVTLTSQAGDSDVLPEISSFTGIILHNISENVSNPSVGFALDDVNATVIDGQVSNNVPITIQRHGLVGNIQVTWGTGLLIEGTTNGSLTPATGSFIMSADTSQVTVNFTAIPTDPPTQSEVFAIRLAVETRSPPFVARVRTGADVSIIEPWGVIKLTYDSYSALEGQIVNVSVSRLYGSTGAIEVSGISKSPSVIPNNALAADPVIDYPLATLSTILNDKQTAGNIQIILPFNTQVNPLKVFDFSLTGLRTVNFDGPFTTPRLATPIQNASVTIIDAQGGAGVFEFVSSSTTIHEDGSPLVQALINRTSGTAGSVSVQLSIVETRADGTTPANQIASAAEGDYDLSSLATMATFANGETLKSVTVQVLNDNVPELEEYFTILLQNPQGGKAIINPAKSTFEVGIYANDNQGGVFSIVTTSLSLDEDTQPEGTITVSRTGGLFERITIDWQTYYSDGGVHPVALGDLLVRDSGNVTFSPGQSLANITLALSPNKVPASGETFSLRISSSTVGITFAVRVATITAAPSRFSVYQFSVNSRSVVATDLTQVLMIQRLQGLKLSSQVSYSTVESADPITVGEVTFLPALASVHFTSVTSASVLFPIDVGNATIQLNIISADVIPRAFYVTLSVPTDSSSVLQNERAVVVINHPGTESDLYTDYLTAYHSTTPSQLSSAATDILNKLSNGAVSGRNVSLSTTMKLTIEEIISTVTESGISYPASLQSTMASIFNAIIGSGTYDEQFRYALTLKSFARSLVTGRPCDGQSVSISTVSLQINSGRYTPSLLSGMTFTSGVNDYIRLSSSALPITSECVDAHFIEYTDASLYKLPLLGMKVMVLSLDNPSVPTLPNPVTYRVYSPSGTIYPSDQDCLVWSYPTDDSGTGSWDQSTCTLAEASILERDYVECQCQLVGDYAVGIPPSYGWPLPGPISSGFVVLVMILIIALHTIYFKRIKLGTRILIFVCLSIALFQIILLIDMVVAPTVSTNGCIALGLLLQLTVLAQFVWMFVLVMSLWMNLMGLTDGNEPLIIYIFVGWGIAIAIVIATILISLFGAAQSWSDIYGRVGGLCFMPSPAIAGVSSALPIILVLLIGVGILSHSCFYWSKWEDFKSLYKDTFNKREIPLLLTFMAIIVINIVFGALHLYLQQIYLFFLFFAFNIIEGIYALIVYLFVSWHTLTWKHKHYPIKEDVEPLTIPEEPEFMGEHYPSMYGSQLSLLPRTSTHNKLSSHGQIGSQEHIMMKRLSPPPTTATPSVHSSVKPSHTSKKKKKQKQKQQEKRADSSLPPSLPPSPPPIEEVQEKDGDSDSGESGSYAIARAGDSDGGESGSHMDNLMFALKTGISYSQDEDSQPPIEGFARRGKQPAAATEQYRLRRISIADTHL
uniref:Staphylococcus aureus surface protein A n=3 Tax=Amphimedon queenslandica TaxID=400682 RepID=A0A1X7VF86_AMPQE